jgi:hypothetical protein
VFKKGQLPGLLRLYGKISEFEKDLLKNLNDRDQNLESILDGGISFDDNVDCVFVSYTTNAAPNTQDSVAHTLGKIPIGFIVISLDKAGIIYKSAAYTATNLLLKCNVASVAATLIVF